MIRANELYTQTVKSEIYLLSKLPYATSLPCLLFLPAPRGRWSRMGRMETEGLGARLVFHNKLCEQRFCSNACFVFKLFQK